MASANTDWFGQGRQAWEKAQQSYWQNWMRWMQSNPTADSPFPSFAANVAPDMEQFWSESFVDAFDRWRQMFFPKAPESAKDFMGRATGMGRSYLQMAEAFYRAGSGKGSIDEELINSWLGAMQVSFKQWKQQLESGFDVEMPGIPGFESMVMKFWQSMIDTMMSGAALQGREFPDFSAMMFPGAGPGRQQLDKMLGMPALGYGREKQEKIRQFSELLAQYGDALKAYRIAFAGLGMRSFKEMKKRLDELEQPIDSMRGLYDFWVEVNEDVYGKFAMSDEYQVIYGDLVNSLMAVRQASRELMEDMYEAMHLPTQTDVDALSSKLQQARRENRELRKQFTALNRRVDILEKEADKKPSKTTRKTASRKVVTQKDDLTQIKGIGSKMQERLYEHGITAMEQLAAMSRQSVEELEKAINATGRITREQWVRQARSMLDDEN